MRNFQDTFETRKRSFISTFSICMTVPLKGVIDSTLVLEKRIELREGKYCFDYRYKYTKRRLDQLPFFLLGYVSSRIKR